MYYCARYDFCFLLCLPESFDRRCLIIARFYKVGLLKLGLLEGVVPEGAEGNPDFGRSVDPVDSSPNKLQSPKCSPNLNRLYFMKPWVWQWLGPYLHTVEFSKNLEALRKVPVILTFLSHWFLTWLSWLGSFSRTPMHLVSRLRARLFLWWSSLSSLCRILSSVSSSLK